MSIFYADGQDNALTNDNPNDMFLRHKPLGNLDEAALLRRMEARNLSVVNVSGPTFVVQFFEEAALALDEGYNVSTALFRMSVSIRGSVDKKSLGRTISSDKVSVEANFESGRLLDGLSKNKQISIAKNLASGGPMVQVVSEPVSGTVDQLEIGGMVLVEGINIAIKGERDSENGVFFTSEADDTVVHISAGRIYPNYPSRLQFILPAAVTAGQWRVSVATQAGANSKKLMPEPRTGYYGRVVTVS